METLKRKSKSKIPKLDKSKSDGDEPASPPEPPKEIPFSEKARDSPTSKTGAIKKTYKYTLPPPKDEPVPTKMKSPGPISIPRKTYKLSPISPSPREESYTPAVTRTDLNFSQMKEMEGTSDEAASMANFPISKVTADWSKLPEEQEESVENRTPSKRETGQVDTSTYLTPDTDLSTEFSPSQKTSFNTSDTALELKDDTPPGAGISGFPKLERRDDSNKDDPAKISNDKVKQIPFKVRRIDDVLKDFHPLNTSSKYREFKRKLECGLIVYQVDEKSEVEMKKLGGECLDLQTEPRETSDPAAAEGERTGMKTQTRDVEPTDTVFTARPILPPLVGTEHMEPESAIVNSNVKRTPAPEVKIQLQETSSNSKDWLPVSPDEIVESPDEIVESPDEIVESPEEEGKPKTVERSRPQIHVMRLLDSINPVLDVILEVRYLAYRATSQLKWLENVLPSIMREILGKLEAKGDTEGNPHIAFDLGSRMNQIYAIADKLKDEFITLVACVNDGRPEDVRTSMQKIHRGMDDLYIQSADILMDCKYVLEHYDSVLQDNPEGILLRMRIKTDVKYVEKRLNKSIQKYILVRERLGTSVIKYLKKQLDINEIGDVPEDATPRPRTQRELVPISVNRSSRFLAFLRNILKEVKFLFVKMF